MSRRKILISPMNWGFGHAGRMIPLALELQMRGHEIIFAAHKNLIPLLEKDLPGITLMTIADMDIFYLRKVPQYWAIFLQVPAIIFSVLREHYELRRLVRKVKPDIIISDNRPGFWHNEVYSVYITHQLRVQFTPAFKILEPAGVWLHRQIINRYDLCLVPDLPGKENLSGRLSHDVRLPGNVMYIGPLSRFTALESHEEVSDLRQPYYCLVLSGPEPQRSMLLEKVIRVLRGFRLVVLSGTSVKQGWDNDQDITIFINPDTRTMKRVISGSVLVITRSGYTSVMELVSLGKSAILIPTPGQTEQEYLGQYLNSRYGFITVQQQHIEHIREIVASYAPLPVTPLPDGKALFDRVITMLPEQEKKGKRHHTGTGKKA